ncbi:MAG: hypothetical protein IKV74_05970 [Clostridia bacterium]|nr:hypothetical protein [Clostridia bacterium]
MVRYWKKFTWLIGLFILIGALAGCDFLSMPAATSLPEETAFASATLSPENTPVPTTAPETILPSPEITPPAVTLTQTVQPTYTATPIHTPKPIEVPTSVLTPTKTPDRTSTPAPTPTKTPTSTPGGSAAITKAEAYCRTRLTQSQQVAYDTILAGFSNPNNIQSVTDAGVTKYQIKVAVKYSATSGLEAELKTILSAIFMDHPELYYIGKQYSYSYQGNRLTELKMDTTDRNTALSFHSQVENGIRAYQQKVSPYQDQYEIAKQFYELLANNIQYGQDGTDHAYSIAGAFANNLCVCEGFSEAYQLLLNAYGIRAFTVSGDANGPHQWIAMEINGRWYYSDPTWGNLKTYGDPTSYPKEGYIRVNYAYLNVTQAMLDVSHQLDAETAFFTSNLNFTATQDNYFIREGGFFQDFQEDAVAAYIKTAIAKALSNQRETVGIRMGSKQAYDALIDYVYHNLFRIYNEVSGDPSCSLTYYPGENTYTVHISIH